MVQCGRTQRAIVLASCADTISTFGGLIAMQNLINGGDPPPAVISISYSECEAENGATANAAYNSAYQQAVAEGVSIFVSAGDSGAAGCDGGANVTHATHGIGVNALASTPYNVAVGGTDFSDTYLVSNSTYWSATNSSNYGSALSYIPEIPWNDSCASALLSNFLTGTETTYGKNGFCNSSQGGSYLTTVAGSGGPSGCATGSPSSGAGIVSGNCQGWTKPSWQAALSRLGNPNDGVRDVPDVSLFAANGVWGHYYIFCWSDTENGGADCADDPSGWAKAGGTSFAAPIMAGIQALINQKTGQNQGNPNSVYYQLAATEYNGSSSACDSNGTGVASTCIFYDITQGDIDVNCTGRHNCYLDLAQEGVLSTSNNSYNPAYRAASGWDFATGIGSINAANLANNWPNPPLTPSITSVSPSSGRVGTSVTITGANFGATQGTSTVTFNGAVATPTSWSATSIVAPVPTGAGTGNVVVTVGGMASNGVSFTVTTTSPSITGLNPASGPVGTSVTITGANFGSTQGASTVTFNGTVATPTSWSDMSIVVQVPTGAGTGNVVVTVGGLASNGVSFTVTTTSPIISGLSPRSGPVGTSVTITGTNFGSTQGASTVTFNGTVATPTSWSATGIVAPVPAGASTGGVVVTVGGQASNAASFTVSIISPSEPTLIQHVSSSNTRGFGLASPFCYHFQLPNPTTSGNAVMVGFTFNSNPTPTVTDDQGDSYAIVENHYDSANNQSVAIAAAFNVSPGARNISVCFNSDPGGWVQPMATEFNNVVAVDGLGAGSQGTGTSVTAGTLTPTVSGDLAYQVVFGPLNQSSFAAGSQENIAWNLLSADLMDGWAGQYGVYNSTSAIHPTMNMGASQQWWSAAILLQAGTAGSVPSGMRIVHLVHENLPVHEASGGNGPFPNPLPLQLPSSGNLLVAMIGGGPNFETVTSLTDTNNNSWIQAGSTLVTHDSVMVQTYFAGNAVSSSNLGLTLNWSGTDGDYTIHFYDVTGAAASPLDTTNGATDFQNDTSGTLTVPYTLTPAQPGELIFTDTMWDANTGTGLTSSSGTSYFDTNSFSGESLSGPEPVDENNGWGHVISTSTSPISFTWSQLSTTLPAGNWASMAVAFLAAGNQNSQPVATPTFSPVAGTYNVAQSVTISDVTAGAQIYYTTDESIPSTTSTLYDGTAIVVSTTTTIQAIAVAGGLPNSAIASATYTIQPTTSQPPSAVSVTPNSGSGLGPQTFSYLYSDSSGYQNIYLVQTILNTTPTWPNSCGTMYIAASSSLYLMSDDGTSWMGPLTIGQAGTLQNSQCTLNAGASSASGSGTNLTVNLSLTFQSGFTGLQNNFMLANDVVNNLTSGLQNRGTWSPDPATAPSAVSVTPNNGSGSGPQTFSYLYSDSSGYQNIYLVQTILNTTLSWPGSCGTMYIAASSSLYLMNDAGNNWLGPLTIGQPGALQNSECTLDAGASSASGSGTNLTVNLALTFQPGFTGPKSNFMLADDVVNNLTSGLQNRGTWSPDPATAPSAVSVTPNNGSGSGPQTFSYLYSDSSGYQNIYLVQTILNTTLSWPNSCGTMYIAASGLYLMNDAGNNWLGPLTIGQPGTLQNSQCTLDAGASSASGSGTNLTVNLAFTFQPGFTGPKSNFMLADDVVNNLTSGFQNRGTWSPDPATAPSAVSVTPNNGSGSGPQTFSYLYSDSSGYQNIYLVQTILNTTLSWPGSCGTMYIAASSSLYLMNDAGNSWLGPLTIGQPGALQNSECTLDAGASSASGSGTNLTVNLSLTFQPGFTGLQNNFMLANDVVNNLTSSIQNRGTWTPSP